MEQDSQKDLGPRKALGRGLAALIPGAAAAATGNTGLRQLPMERVRPNRSQPRKHFDTDALEELASSIKVRGVLQPIVVRRAGEEYEIVAGERRWRAAGKAGLTEIPAVIKELADADVLQVALVENVQRQDLDPLEEAEAYHRLVQDYGHSQEQVAEAVGKNRATIANALRLLKLPAAIMAMLADGRLTAGHARAVMQLSTEADMARLAEEITKHKLSVRDAEQRARAMAAAAKPRAAVEQTASEQHVQERLQRALGTKVRLHHRKGKGRIEVFFHSLDELDAILDKIAP